MLTKTLTLGATKMLTGTGIQETIDISLEKPARGLFIRTTSGMNGVTDLMMENITTTGIQNTTLIR